MSEVANDVFVGTPDVLIEKLRSCRDFGMKDDDSYPEKRKCTGDKGNLHCILRDEVFNRL